MNSFYLLPVFLAATCISAAALPLSHADAGFAAHSIRGALPITGLCSCRDGYKWCLDGTEGIIATNESCDGEATWKDLLPVEARPGKRDDDLDAHILETAFEILAEGLAKRDTADVEKRDSTNYAQLVSALLEIMEGLAKRDTADIEKHGFTGA